MSGLKPWTVVSWGRHWGFTGESIILSLNPSALVLVFPQSAAPVAGALGVSGTKTPFTGFIPEAPKMSSVFDFREENPNCIKTFQQLSLPSTPISWRGRQRLPSTEKVEIQVPCPWVIQEEKHLSPKARSKLEAVRGSRKTPASGSVEPGRSQTRRPW